MIFLNLTLWLGFNHLRSIALIPWVPLYHLIESSCYYPCLFDSWIEINLTTLIALRLSITCILFIQNDLRLDWHFYTTLTHDCKKSLSVYILAYTRVYTLAYTGVYTLAYKAYTGVFAYRVYTLAYRVYTLAYIGVYTFLHRSVHPCIHRGVHPCIHRGVHSCVHRDVHLDCMETS